MSRVSELPSFLRLNTIPLYVTNGFLKVANLCSAVSQMRDTLGRCVPGRAKSC